MPAAGFARSNKRALAPPLEKARGATEICPSPEDLLRGGRRHSAANSAALKKALRQTPQTNRAADSLRKAAASNTRSLRSEPTQPNSPAVRKLRAQRALPLAPDNRPSQTPLANKCLSLPLQNLHFHFTLQTNADGRNGAIRPSRLRQLRDRSAGCAKACLSSWHLKSKQILVDT